MSSWFNQILNSVTLLFPFLLKLLIGFIVEGIILCRILFISKKTKFHIRLSWHERRVLTLSSLTRISIFNAISFNIEASWKVRTGWDSFCAPPSLHAVRNVSRHQSTHAAAAIVYSAHVEPGILLQFLYDIFDISGLWRSFRIITNGSSLICLFIGPIPLSVYSFKTDECEAQVPGSTIVPFLQALKRVTCLAVVLKHNWHGLCNILWNDSEILSIILLFTSTIRSLVPLHITWYISWNPRSTSLSFQGLLRQAQESLWKK